jgi:GNAT superfamily N-acetyltransferase
MTTCARIPRVTWTRNVALHFVERRDEIPKLHTRQAIDIPPICHMVADHFGRHGRQVAPARIVSTMPTIRPACADEYDEIARVWMDSWASTGLEETSNFLLANLRARVSREVEDGWSLFVADDGGRFAAMLALRLPDSCLGQLFVAPDYQGKGLGKRLLAFAREHMPNEIWLRCVRENDKAWRWYEREGFVFEKEEVNPMTGFIMKTYRWKRGETGG